MMWLLRRKLTSSDPDTRKDAVRTLASRQDAESTALILSVLHDADQGVQLEGVKALSQRGLNPEVTTALVQLEASANKVLSQAATIALSDIGMGLVFALFSENRMTSIWSPYPGPFARDDSLSDERAHATRVLSGLGDIATVPLGATIKDVARDKRQYSDNNKHVRRRAVWALGQIRTPLALSTVTEALRSSDDGVASEARDALLSLGAAGESLTPSLLAHSEISMKLIGLELLGRAATPSAVKQLEVAFRESTVTKLRETAASELKKVGWKPTNTKDQVMFALEHRDSKTCVALGAQALPSLHDALRQNARETAFHTALSAVSDICHVDSSPFLISILGNPKEDRSTREAAAKALTRIGGTAAVNALVTVLMKEDDDWMQGCLTDQLASVGSDEAVAALGSLVSQGRGVVNVAHALGKIRRPSVVGLLSRLLDSESASKVAAEKLVGLMIDAPELFADSDLAVLAAKADIRHSFQRREYDSIYAPMQSVTETLDLSRVRERAGELRKTL